MCALNIRKVQLKTSVNPCKTSFNLCVTQINLIQKLSVYVLIVKFVVEKSLLHFEIYLVLENTAD